MRKYYSIPLLFFSLAAALGLFLRWQFVTPTPGIRYTFFLHAHSHVMFLGWVFNVLYLSFIDTHLAQNERRPFYVLFVVLQLLVVAMMISFPIQGYGPFSIVFSTLHTLAVMGFIAVFLRRTRNRSSVSLWFARVGLFFFFLSTAGPFSLGYLMANDLGGTVWYNFSIYYYLHFQYNGFFLFGVFSLFYQLLETKRIPFDEMKSLRMGRWMALACVPAYLLSTLFAKPGLVFNFIGGAAAIMQLVAVALFIAQAKVIAASIKSRFDRSAYLLLSTAFAALILKSVLQLLSAQPDLAQMAYQLRPVTIAYIHLVVLGVITFFLVAWYAEMGYVTKTGARISAIMLFVGFAGSELCMVVTPWWSVVFGSSFTSSAAAIFVFSILLLVATVIFYGSYLSQKPDKNQSHA